MNRSRVLHCSSLVLGAFAQQVAEAAAGITKYRRCQHHRHKRVLGVMAIAIVAISVSSLRAHHSFAAEFDANKPITLKGTVVKMDWVNPHSWIHLDVKNPDGTVTRWMIEGGTPNTLVRRGFTKNSLLPGTEITIEGYQAKNGANRANGADLILPDGKRLFMGSSGTGAPKDPEAGK